MAGGNLAGWREPGGLGPDDPTVASDAEARTIVEAARRRQEPPPTLGLLGGDLCRTLGGRGDEPGLRSDDAMRYRTDLGAVLLDGRVHWFVAHLVAHRPGWRGEILVAMNAEWCGSLCLGPRAHPGDGLLDLTHGQLPWRDRLRARQRARSGTHVPHPGLRVERTAAHQHSFDRATPVWLDGEPMGPVRNLSIRVEPGALRVVV